MAKKQKIVPNPGAPPTHPNNTGLQEITLIWLSTIFSTLIVYIAIGSIIQRFYVPDVALIKSASDKLLIGASIVRPEPVEALLFRVAVVSIPLLLWGFYLVYKNLNFIKILAAKPAFHFIAWSSVFLIVLMIVADFMANDPFSKVAGKDIPQIRRDFTSISNFDFYFKDLFLGKFLLIYTFILAPLICRLFFTGYRKFQNPRFIKILEIIGYSMLGIVVTAIVAMCTFNFPYQSENQYDFNAVYYSMTQVYAGMPLLVDGFTNTYGLYPQFLSPLFHLIGLSVGKFSLTMALLTGTSFLMNFYCLRQFVKNKFILFSGIFSVLFFTFLNFEFTEHFDPHFAFHAIRYFVPSLLMLMSVKYLRNPSVKRFWLITIIMAASVLWNPEFGLVSLIAWLLLVTYHDFYDSAGNVNYKKMAITWTTGAITLLLVFYVYQLLIFLCYGAVPRMAQLWTSLFIFSKMGFGLLPMHLVHPWNIVALVLITGLLYAITGWRDQKSADRSFVFLLSVLGVGFFFYFQGRSHNWNLAQSSGMTLLLLTILGDKLWERIKNGRVIALYALFAIFLYVISISIFEIVYNADQFRELVMQENKDKDESMSLVEDGKDFILENSAPDQKIYVLSLKKYQGLLFDGQRRSAFNPGLIDLFYNSDLEKLNRQLQDSSYPVFIIPQYFYEAQFAARPLGIIAATYECAKSKGAISLLRKRSTRLPGRAYFDSSGPVVFHRKYTDDKTGTNNRVNDAMGCGRVTLAPEFCVEVLFNAKKQVFTVPTLIGNMPDSTGFVISKVLNSPDFLFGINGMGYYYPVVDSGWTYCAMNVFRDHFAVYINGKLLVKKDIPAPIRNSASQLCVGNLGNIHYFVGAISEVRIINEAQDETHIGATCKAIMSHLNE